MINEYIKKKGYFALLCLSVLVLGFSIYQYAIVSQLESANAYTTSKPDNGHFWSDMECSSTLCITGGNIGVGTDAPTTKLDIVGTLKATNFCTTSNICLNSITDFLR